MFPLKFWPSDGQISWGKWRLMRRDEAVKTSYWGSELDWYWLRRAMGKVRSFKGSFV
jgi:hypothetical protein